MKKFLIITAILLLCLAIFAQQIASIALKRLAIVGLNRIINTKAEIAALDVNLFSGVISFTGFNIQNPAGYNTKYFSTIPSGYIELNKRSLFSKNIEIKRVFLDRLAVNIELNNAGISNNSIIFKKKNKGRKGTAPAGAAGGQRGSLKISEIVVKDGIYKLVNYKVNREGASVMFDHIDIAILNLTPPKNLTEMPTAIKCQARLPANDRVGKIGFSANGGFLVEKIDFDMDLTATNISLPYFMPFYVNTAPILAKSGHFDLRSIARCRKNQLDAIQKVDMKAVEVGINSVTRADNLVFGLPVMNVTNFFVNNQGRFIFEFNISGTIDNPQFHLGEALKKVLASSIQNAILNSFSNISGTIIDTVGEAGRVEDAGKEILKNVKDIFKQILSPGGGQTR